MMTPPAWWNLHLTPLTDEHSNVHRLVVLGRHMAHNKHLWRANLCAFDTVASFEHISHRIDDCKRECGNFNFGRMPEWVFLCSN